LSETPLWFLIIQVLTTATLVATFVAFLAQLRTMHQQVEVARQSTLAQNTLAVAQYLSQPEIRAGRRHVFRVLGDKPFSKWTDDDRIEAERVCSSYDVAGLIVRAEIASSRIIVENWGASLRRIYRITAPLIQEMRSLSGDPNYWDDFEWLAKQAELIAQPLSR
jgi:hypothetical protein